MLLTVIKMYPLARLCKPNMFLYCRYYRARSQRCPRNYYETLRISPNSSQKEIRQAFLKLSKELHPDATGKSNHNDFVEINEAYRILSKENTKRQYDMQPKCQNSGVGGSPHKVVYANPYQWEVEAEDTNPVDYENNYYGFRGIKKMRNVTIALVCLVVSSFGSAFLFLFILKKAHAEEKLAMKKSARYKKEFRNKKYLSSVQETKPIE
ncbi:dnaJ-like protein 60 [Orussus abietinus]|uniref:dnaJ-like protein 60 n=1 Tax=Orussus abietinus TaxID=222816 RepID=UPI000625448B|nr:dnaJ-like protein 60 [Orussus abietinus]